jgi:hypothetical protein
MAQRVTIPFVGQTAVSKNVMVQNQETVNFTQSIKGRGAKAPMVLESAPGLIDLGALGNGPLKTSQMVSSDIRGLGVNDLYGVYGSKLMAQTIATGNLEIGTLNGNPGRVPIARGRNYIAMVDGTDGYTYNGTVFAQITDLDFPGNLVPAGKPTHIVYMDGFFIVNDANTDNFYISALEDPTSWNALDFDAASVSPDKALAIAQTESILWIFGDETAQGYYNSGNADFPYQIILTATQEVGILAPDSLAESDDGIFYLATTPEGGRFVYQIQGQSGRVITDDSQEQFLLTVDNPGLAWGFIYKQGGESYYVLQLGETSGLNAKLSTTLVYNIKAQAWESRETQDGTAWRAGGHGILGGRNIVGSRLQARQLELSLDTYTDAGEELIRRRRSQIYHVNNQLMDWWAIVIDIQGGVGNQVDPGADPKLRLRYSNDGGQSWSNWLQQSIGKIGETLQRCQFLNLGQARNRVFEVEYSEPTDLTIINAYAVLEVLND